MTFHLALGLETGGMGADSAFFAAVADWIDDEVTVITIEDGFAASGGDGLDALTLANWLGARTRRVGIVPGAPVNFLEPFHVSTAIATLDYVTQGRAGVLVQSLHGGHATRAKQAIGALGGFPDADPAALAADQTDAIEVIRRLWDSWQDDAVIRDPVSQRFVDGSRLHYIDFKGTRFSVLGPSITPRPPQGQPIIAANLQAGEDPAAVAGADLVFLGAVDEAAVAAIVGRLPTGKRRPLLFADVLLSFGRTVPAHRPALGWTGAPETLAAQAEAWGRGLGLDGLRLIPADHAQDLAPVLPVLRTRASARHGTLRAQLGLPPAPNRYVSNEPAAA